jgi:predicted anti-sigma-YlaC factor YlaD
MAASFGAGMKKQTCGILFMGLPVPAGGEETNMRRSDSSRAAASLSTALWAIALCALIPTLGCSIKKVAVNKLGNALAGSGTTFSSDNDPELIAAAAPFSLKLMESLLAESPKHQGLLLAASSGFTQYAYLAVQEQADEAEAHDMATATVLKTRARLLYLRARDYGLRGLETRHKGFRTALRKDPKTAVMLCDRRDVAFLYWAAAAWGSAISVSKELPDLIADQTIVEALIDRAAALDPDFSDGAIQQFLITYEPARPGGGKDYEARSLPHFNRAVEIAHGQMAGPYVSYAESISLPRQNRAQFETMLHQALSVDPDEKPEWRLANMVMQRRARWLLSREDDLFLDPVDSTTPVGSAGAQTNP